MNKATMDKIVSLAKRRGFIFPSSEIYGGIGGFWDYGPYGVLLKNNVKAGWWKSNVQERDDMLGLDSAIVANPKVWEASGHVAKFADPMVDCKKCKKRFRADHLAEKFNNEEDGTVTTSELKELARLLKNKKCLECGGELTEPREFNLMFKTYVGPVEDSSSVAYLRPETCQPIFINFENIRQAGRKKVPFGIAQIGKAFRNEITPGNFTFRSREFEQMEIEYFVHPKEADRAHEEWKKNRMQWFLDFGVKKDKLRFRKHDKDELSHYAKSAFDIEYNFPFGWKELEGIANRTDYDLKCQSKFSGRDLSYFNEETKERYFPYVIEPSLGADRAALAFLIDAYHEEEVKGEARVVLKFDKRIAPIKIAILPLSKNEKLSPKAKQVFNLLKNKFMCEYDETQSIGKRYRRQDEIGTPYAVTIDFDTLTDNAVTIRDRDTMKQDRIKIEELDCYLSEKLD